VERKRFLTRLRPFWEVHRHRMAVNVGERFRNLCESGAVRLVAGRVALAAADDNVVRLVVNERRTGATQMLEAAWVVNCTGPAPSNSPASNPAIGSLLVHGWLRPDELGLGIESTEDGAAIDSAGLAVGDLFIVGTLRKPALWESTAAPELRGQAATVADHV